MSCMCQRSRLAMGCFGDGLSDSITVGLCCMLSLCSTTPFVDGWMDGQRCLEGKITISVTSHQSASHKNDNQRQSPVSSHQSPISRSHKDNQRQSPVNSHQSAISRSEKKGIRQSPINNYQLPISRSENANHQSPIPNQQSPVTNQQVRKRPIANRQSTVTSHQSALVVT